MLYAGQGLVAVTTDELKTALGALHRGELPCPLHPAVICGLGLQHASERLLGVLRGLDERGVRAVLTAVLAERAKP